jgi:glycosidase
LDPSVDRWWNDTVFYEVFVRSFQESDGDGIGDIQGLIQRLDYLNDGDPATTSDLGVTGLWLMPITESPSYHGYDVVDYYSIETDYGTSADFQQLIEEAHRRGIRVIVDLVLNHTSTQHPWFIAANAGDPAFRDWYIWEEESPNYAGPEGQPVWHRGRSGYYYGVFWSGMPDLNLENPAVTTALQAITRFWLEEMGVDGFRLDAIKHLIEQGQVQENTAATHAWLEAYYDFYKQVAPEAFTVGEAWTSTSEVVDYTGDEVDVAFQFDLARSVLGGVDQEIGTFIAQMQQQVVESFPQGQYATFLANHDQNRVMSQLGGDVEKAKMAASWLLTAPGVPFIYYGEEIGLLGIKPDEDIRRPMQWTPDVSRAGFTTGTPWRPPFADAAERNVALQDTDPDSLLNHYRALIHLRNAHPALSEGDWWPVQTGSPHIYAFLRHVDEEALLVILNLADSEEREYELTLPAGPLPAAVSTALLFGVEQPAPVMPNSGGGFDAYQPYPALPPYSTVIIGLEP